MHVSSLHIYPVKGCRAVDLTEAAIERRGLAHDRRWLIVDANNRFITQREMPKLATIGASLEGSALHLSHDGGSIVVKNLDDTAPRLTVTLWKQQVEGYAGNDAADEFLSSYLGQPCRIIWQGELPRSVSPKYAPNDATPTSYADDFPLLVTVTESLDDLNRRMAQPLPMNRFRPNIVITGASAWAEDAWRKITIGAVTLDLPKPCTRCVVTTTDQRTGEKAGNEPLQTLKSFRLLRTPALTGVVFGQNAIPQALGTVKIGDKVAVAESQPAPAFVSVG